MVTKLEAGTSKEVVMSNATRKALRELQQNVARRAPLVEKRLAKVGVHDPAVVFSTAQYYDTLKKLAKK